MHFFLLQYVTDDIHWQQVRFTKKSHWLKCKYSHHIGPMCKSTLGLKHKPTLV